MQRPIRITKSRFEAFSDGVFAIAITLLVLGFQPPKAANISDQAMTNFLFGLWPQYLVYAASFATVGIMWFNHYALFHHTRYISYGALVANTVLLLLVAFLPYPTQLLGQYGLLSSLVFFYCLVMLVISVVYGILWYVVKLGPGQRGSIIGFLASRTAWNTMGLIVYALAMVVALFAPVWSVVMVAAMALFYALPSSVGAALDASAAGSSLATEADEIKE